MGSWKYVERKIAHLKRAGLVSASSNGVGLNGGAAPDWLVTEQKARREAATKAEFLNRVRRFAA